MEHTELPFEAGARRPLAGQFEHQRMDGEVDAFDVLGAQTMRVPDLQATVDTWMNHNSARERFVGVE